METTQYIGYIRRSKKQQESSLGIEAQQAEIDRHTQGGNLIHTYVELETGTAKGRHKRTVILQAIEHCKQSGAILIIAKLDRLARDVEFTARLMNNGVKFIACDIPGANEFTIHVMAAMAEQEAKRISERTKAALARKKGPLGWQLHKTRQGCPFTDEGRRKAGAMAKQRAKDNPNNKRAINYAKSLLKEGMPYDKIADKMILEGFESPRGTTINKTTIYRWVKHH